MARMKRYWRIVGYDGEDQIFERTLPKGYLTENQVVTLLQRLASKHLEYHEIVESSVKADAPIRRALLEPLRGIGGKRPTISIEAGITYVASIWREDELPNPN